MVNKIILVGYMAVGKTTIGKTLAKELDLPHLDLDLLIEKMENKTVDELFGQKGELYFRKLEHRLFKELIDNKDSFVLSVGGGTPCYYDNHLLLQNSSVTSVYLEASISTIYDRLVSEKLHRPIVKDLNEMELKDFIGKHLFERSFYYHQANHKIKVDNKEAHDVCVEISKLLF